jgi:large subunit ribosomal protein L24
MAKIKKGDTVLVIAGKDKGLTGKVLEVEKDDSRVIVEGVNRVKRHTQQTESERGVKQGGILTIEAPIHLSNVMLVEDNKGVRVGFRKDENGKNVRVSRRSGKDI